MANSFLPLFLFVLIDSLSHASVLDQPFVQEFHEAHVLPGGVEANRINSVDVDAQGAVWAGSDAGVVVFDRGVWAKIDGLEGPVFDIFVDGDNVVWVASWDGLYSIVDRSPKKIEAIQSPIATVGPGLKGMLAVGPDNAWRCDNGEWRRIKKQFSFNARKIVRDSNGDVWIASALGLYRLTGDDILHYVLGEDITYSECTDLTFDPMGRLWVSEFGGVDVFENGVRVRSFTAANGLPWFDVRAINSAPDGTIWIGTDRGAAKFKDGQWLMRHSHRWLLDDEVNDIAVDANGTAWIATNRGISAIRNRTMTLAEKADRFQAILEKRHIRKPGFVEKCYFPNPEDRSRFEPWDDDNDGQYTSMYIVMESMQYAVTGDPDAKDRADRAFDALEMLQTITGTEHFVARTMIPSDWTRMADANEEIPPKKAAERRVRDPRYKPVEVRWRPSADGKWLWKGDTSSDEITGHFFGYYFYYKLAADESRKERVRNLVRRIMDGIIEGGYVLRDIDGKATRWGVWSPERLLNDPDWRNEAPINAFEILSFLKVTYFITGDEKYQKEYLRLIEEHGYLGFCRRPKTYTLSDRTHIDDELLALAAPGLMLCEDDPQLKKVYLEGLTWAFRTVENEWNPFFNFIFALIGGQDFHLDESVAFLRDHPLDLIQWRVDNGWRDDVKLVRYPLVEPLQLSRMLPPSERNIMRWDKNPWPAVSGDISDSRGSWESCGVHWLLPYWLGRYMKLIEE